MVKDVVGVVNEGINMKCPRCGSNITITSGGNAGAIYCNKSAKLIKLCDGVKRV